MIRVLSTAVVVVVVFGAVACASLVGCQNQSDAPATQPRREAKMETFTGKLESGVMAIGGESTGWRLVGDNEAGGIDLDVARVRERAEQLTGRHVTVSGKMTQRDYVERGKVRVLVAERIEPSR
jgi:hypothetical protein